MPNLLQSRPQMSMNRVPRLEVFEAETLTDCLLQARRSLGPDAEIISQRKIKKGGVLGRWGGKEWMSVTCRLSPGSSVSAQRAEELSQMKTLELRVADLAAGMQTLVEAAKQKPFQAASLAPPSITPANRAPSPVQYAAPVTPPEPAISKTPRILGRSFRPPPPQGEPYQPLLRQLLDSEVAGPLARQWINDLPANMTDSDARTELRTRIAQRLRIDARPATLPRGQVRVMAFIGTTGAGKTTTIAKLAARYALAEHRRVGIITLDTFRVAASQQLQTYGAILRVPVRVAQDHADVARFLTEFASGGTEIVLLDTTGRSPNEMIPLGETAGLFSRLGNVEKYLTIPATSSARDMEHVVARFRHAFDPDAIVLTKLDEAIDNACFGRLLTVQTKFGLPLAYVATGQKVPDDLAVPDAHAIAARLVSSALI